MSDDKNRLLAELYEKHYDSVFRLCFQQVGFQERFIPLIEDCIHEAFGKAIVHYEDYRHYLNPMGWIADTARNCLLSELRKERNRSSQVSLVKMAMEQDISNDIRLTDIERWFDQEECKEKLCEIQNLLTEQERIIYDAYFEKDLTRAETVEQTGLSGSIVKSTVSRIRKKARRLFHLLIIMFSF